MGYLILLLIFAVAGYYGYNSIHIDQKKMHNPSLPRFVGVVRRVVDGDTLDISEGDTVHRVRICGMDAPEAGQDFGDRATTALARVATGRSVQVVGVERDKYGRLVAYVNLNGESIGVAMVSAGLAWADRYGQTPREFIIAEQSARDARKGIWAGPIPPVYPRDFRNA